MITIKKLSDISADFDLRFDYKFHSLSTNHCINIGSQTSKHIRLKDILIPTYVNFNYKPEEEYKGISTNNENFDQIGNIIDYEPVSLDNHSDRLKYKAGNNFLLLSSLKGAKCLPFLITEDYANAVFSNAFYIYQTREGNNPLFIKSILQLDLLKKILDENLYRGIGIATFKERDFLNINVPLVSVEKQNEAAEKILAINKEITHNIQKSLKNSDIINRIFEKEFSFSTSEFFEQKNANYYVSSLYQNATSFDLRTSCKFHSPTYKLLDTILHKIGSRKIKSILAKDIRLGASISPQHYDEENGTALYVSMKAIKNRVFEVDNCTKVTDEYWENNKKYDSLQIGDILIARSGEGTIGKAAMINEDVQAIFCDFIMRVRLNKENNPLFVTHYFNSDLFQFLVERDKKGLGNNTNIFPSQIKEFFIPSISLHRQINIAEEIQAEIDSQNNIDTEIAAKRKAIEEIVLSVMS